MSVQETTEPGGDPGTAAASPSSMTEEATGGRRSRIPFRTTKPERITYGIYFFGQLVFYGLVTGFQQLYMTEIGISATVVGGIFIVVKIWDAINDPLFGVIVDKAHLKSGKFIPWVRISSFLIPVATIFLFSAPLDASIQVKAIWATVGYVLWDAAYTICDVPALALATSMTDEPKERNWLYLLNRLFMLVGVIAVGVIVPLMYPSIGWSATAVIVSLLAMVTMVPLGFKAKERYFEHAEKEAGSEAGIGALIRYIGKNKYLLVFNGTLILACLSNTVGVVGNYVAIYCLGDAKWIAILSLVTAIPTLLCVPIVNGLIKKYDKFTVFVVSQLGSGLLCWVMYMVGYENLGAFLSVTMLRAVFGGATSIMLVMFTADCAEYGHFTTGERAQGMAFSIQTLTSKITGGLPSAIGMFLLGAVGFVSGSGAEQSAGTIGWIWNMYTWMPLVAATPALILVLVFYKLRDHDVELMMRANSGEITREEAQAQFTRAF